MYTVYWISLLICLATTEDSKGGDAYFDDGSCEYVQDKTKFGGGNAGLFLKTGTSFPAVFVCRWEDPAGKWLRFRANKGEGIYHQKDPMSFYLGTAFQCEPGAKFRAESFDANQKIGELSATDTSFPAQNIRVADALS